jgi:hypothetical protein
LRISQDIDFLLTPELFGERLEFPGYLLRRKTYFPVPNEVWLVLHEGVLFSIPVMLAEESMERKIVAKI